MSYNQPVVQSPKALLKATLIIHLALATGQVLFGLVAFFQTSGIKYNPKSNDSLFLYIALFLAVTGFVAGHFLFKKTVGEAVNKSSVLEKIRVYQSAMIVRDALLEGASMFSIVSYMRTGKLFFLAISGAIVLHFIYLRPTKDSIENELDLSYEEKVDLDSQ